MLGALLSEAEFFLSGKKPMRKVTKPFRWHPDTCMARLPDSVVSLVCFVVGSLQEHREFACRGAETRVEVRAPGLRPKPLHGGNKGLRAMSGRRKKSATPKDRLEDVCFECFSPRSRLPMITVVVSVNNRGGQLHSEAISQKP